MWLLIFTSTRIRSWHNHHFPLWSRRSQARPETWEVLEEPPRPEGPGGANFRHVSGGFRTGFRVVLGWFFGGFWDGPFWMFLSSRWFQLVIGSGFWFWIGGINWIFGINHAASLRCMRTHTHTQSKLEFWELTMPDTEESDDSICWDVTLGVWTVQFLGSWDWILIGFSLKTWDENEAVNLVFWTYQHLKIDKLQILAHISSKMQCVLGSSGIQGYHLGMWRNLGSWSRGPSTALLKPSGLQRFFASLVGSHMLEAEGCNQLKPNRVPTGTYWIMRSLFHTEG